MTSSSWVLGRWPPLGAKKRITSTTNIWNSLVALAKDKGRVLGFRHGDELNLLLSIHSPPAVPPKEKETTTTISNWMDRKGGVVVDSMALFDEHSMDMDCKSVGWWISGGGIGSDIVCRRYYSQSVWRGLSSPPSNNNCIGGRMDFGVNWFGGLGWMSMHRTNKRVMMMGMFGLSSRNIQS